MQNTANHIAWKGTFVETCLCVVTCPLQPIEHVETCLSQCRGFRTLYVKLSALQGRGKGAQLVTVRFARVALDSVRLCRLCTLLGTFKVSNRLHREFELSDFCPSIGKNASPPRVEFAKVKGPFLSTTHSALWTLGGGKAC